MIDSNDPDVAVKIIWNNVFRPITSDDYDLRFYDCDSAYERKGPQTEQIEYFQIGHYAGYDLVGRTEVEPMPTDPDFKTTGRYWLFGLYPILAPQEIRGTGFIRYRYADPRRGDDIWSLDAGSRRLRRVNEAIMSSSTTGGGSAAHTWDPDHYSGFNPKTEQYFYKFLGEKNMLATIHAEHSPEQRCPTDGGTSACPETWEMRHMYIVQALPDRSRINALDSRTVIYMDSEMWFEPYIDTYDRAGHLFRAHIYWLATRDRPVPDARVAIYPFKRSFVVGAVSTDVQSGLATMCYLPGMETPERECWYINMGAVDRQFLHHPGDGPRGVVLDRQSAREEKAGAIHSGSRPIFPLPSGEVRAGILRFALNDTKNTGCRACPEPAEGGHPCPRKRETHGGFH